MFFILFNSTYSTHESMLELIDQFREGKQILNSVFVELHSTGPNLQTGKILELLKIYSENASKSEKTNKGKFGGSVKSCKVHSGIIRKTFKENKKNELTISRHINSNKLSLKRNQQFFDRTKAEYNTYKSFTNLVKINKEIFTNFMNDRMLRLTEITKLLRRCRNYLISIDVSSKGKEFVEMKSEFNQHITELKIELSSTEDHLEGLRPIITSLLETMTSPSLGKYVIRSRLIRLLHSIIKSLHHRRDNLEETTESAKIIYEALINRFEENKIRCKKILKMLDYNKDLLYNRQNSLNESLKKSQRFTLLSGKARIIRNKHCLPIKIRKLRLNISLIKRKNIVAQIEEILHERYGAFKKYFIQRKLRLVDIRN